jgi:cell division cycle 20-like protein 1 (cofactor of APC complex)
MGATEEIFSSTVSHTHITKAANALNTPPVNTPPGAMTPPQATEKRRAERTANSEQAKSERSQAMDVAVDPNALSKALMKEFEEAGRPSDVTPGGSPSRKRQRIYGDR